MRVCEQLSPKSVFAYFEDICKIPHGSGNTKEISDYCVNFAKTHHLKWIQDSKNNVIIFKDASKGYENSEPIIIQGHMDMVCEKENLTEIDFEKDSLQLYVDGDFLKAKGTTLGGDDGIALAYALAVLEDDTILHPPLEVVFTVDEEIGMLGAKDIDLSMLKGKKLLNIDSDEEGTFFAGCAGGLQADCHIPISWEQEEGIFYEIKITGLQGGHSGSEIHKERGNAIVLLGRVLYRLTGHFFFSLENISGGLKDNAIPREAACTICFYKYEYESELSEPLEVFEKRLSDQIFSISQELKKEYHVSDSGIEILCEKQGKKICNVLSSPSFFKILFLLRTMPWGVQHMSMEIENLVETSLNLGIMKLEKEYFSLYFSVRSSVPSRKYEVVERLSFLTGFLGGRAMIHGDYPEWEYKPDSSMRKLMIEIYQELFQEEPKIQAIHAGLECGIFSGKIKDLDCISFGPNNYDIHTPKERLSISSTEKIWKLILEFLKRSK